MAKDLTFTISAKDDASKVFSKLSRTAKTEMGKVDDSLEDSRTAGQKLADAFTQLAGDLDAEMTKVEQAADELAQALGPELAAKVDSRQLVTEFKKAGLSVDDVRADVQALAGSVKALDDVQVKHLGDTSRTTAGDMDRLRSSGDQSRSVLANLAGNTAQDLGQIGGAAGSAGVAIGQLAEYAADGNIKLGALVGLAAPMAGLAVVGKLVSDHFADIKKTEAFNTDEVEAFAKALGEGEQAAGAIAQHFADVGKVEFRMSGDTVNVTDEMAALGLTVDQFADLVAGGLPKINAWRQTMLDAGASAEQVDIVTLAASTSAQNFGKATDLAEVNLKVFGDTAEDTAGKVEEVTAASVAGDKAAAEHAETVYLEGQAAQETANKMVILRDHMELKKEMDEEARDAALDHPGVLISDLR